MRVLHLDHRHRWAGQARRIFRLAAAHTAAGHFVMVGVPGDCELAARCRQAGLPVCGEDLLPKARQLDRLVPAVDRLRRLIRDEGFDVVDAHGDLWQSVLAARGTPAAVVRSRHSMRPIPPHPFNRWLHRQVGHLIVNARCAADQAVAAGLLPADRVSVVPTAIEIERFDPTLDAGPVRAELGLPAEALGVGIIGVVDGNKGHHLLAQAAPAILAACPTAHFVVIGDGAALPAVQQQAADLGVAGRFYCLGFREDVPRLLAALDLTVLPSAAEGTPAVLLESQAMRVPVVATRVGGAPEVMVEGRTGLLAPYGDPAALAKAVVELLLDPDRRQAMGEAGRRLVEERFTLDRMAEGTMEAYEKALAVGRGRPGRRIIPEHRPAVPRRERGAVRGHAPPAMRKGQTPAGRTLLAIAPSPEETPCDPPTSEIALTPLWTRCAPRARAFGWSCATTPPCSSWSP